MLVARSKDMRSLGGGLLALLFACAAGCTAPTDVLGTSDLFQLDAGGEDAAPRDAALRDAGSRDAALPDVGLAEACTSAVSPSGPCAGLGIYCRNAEAPEDAFACCDASIYICCAGTCELR